MIMVGAFMVAVTRYFWITSRDAVGENTQVGNNALRQRA